MENTRKIGSVMVLGGGIAGMAIGGMMSQLDKTFPTNDCAM